MTTFCHITGSARNLPKPHYFPLLPPISPAEAKKLCRITGRATGPHLYSPIIALGKPYTFDGLEGCRITKHESLHYFRPIFIKNKDNERFFDALSELQTKMKAKKKKVVDIDGHFVYHVKEISKSVVVPFELEEAIHTGEIESVSISKDGGYVNIKIKQGRIIKLKLEFFPQEELSIIQDSFYYGRGQSKHTLEKQQLIIDERNLRKRQTMARREIFEKKDRKAEEDERRATERPKLKKPRIKFDPKRRKEKIENMERMMNENIDNRAIILPPVSKVDPDEQIMYEQMLEDIAKAQKIAVNVTIICMSKDFDWLEVSKAESAGFDWDSFPREEEEIKPAEIEPTTEISEVPVPASIKLDIAASVELIFPTNEVDQRLLKAIREIKEEHLKTTENASSELKRINCEIPTIDDINDIIANIETYEHGYMIEKEKGKSEFVKRDQYTIGEDLAISGVMVKIKDVEKFICGQIIKFDGKDTFVAGQTIDTPMGKRFVPGQTIVGKDGLINFIPGQCVDNEEGEKVFTAGRTCDSKFVPGQMVDTGDDKPVFMSGQTVMTAEGPKFVPGEVVLTEDGYSEFIPGIKLPTAEGSIFVPGQAFQSDEGLNFTPGQIIDTDEGPSFVSGQSFETPDGQKKFIKGDLVRTEDGTMTFEKRPDIPIIKEDLVNGESVIPNEELQLVCIQGEGILGFAVHPSNTANVQSGEKLYGDIVETASAVLFYLSEKLPSDIDSDAKIISGQLIVGVCSQRFIPGKMITTATGEKFIPGQMVRTNHGEEFVPGQIVESADGPKFVPGQLVITTEGEKFIPGQVIMEEEGPKFVPGQIIHTENGATFIPGQVMSTEEGQKFVPGQLVETKDGPRFVPGTVIESDEGPKFIPGTVVETEDGLKYVPLKHSTNSDGDDSEDDSDISFQGFDVSYEELHLLSLNLPENARAGSPITMQNSLIDSDTLKKLAEDTMVIHGRTPEPALEKKKKKKKKGKVVFDTLDEDNEEEEAEIDNGTDKIDILGHLMRAGTSFSTVRKGRELERVAEILGDGNFTTNHYAQVEALKYLMLNTNKEKFFFNEFFGDDEELMADIILCIGNIDNMEINDQAKKKVTDALQEIVTRNCDKEITSLISKITDDPENLFTDPQAQILLTEAVGIVCVTGDVEVASLLEKFISDPSEPNCLKEDRDVLAVLRQLLVLHRMAERNPDVAKLLQNLQVNPEGVKDRNKVRKLIKKAKLFLTKIKITDKSFDIRHVTSSKDIPTEVFQQIREDKDEAMKFIEKLPDELFHAIIGDQRCGDKFLQSLTSSSKSEKSKKELDKFKKGMAIVVTKENMQAVIPRHFARSVCYGIMPYILIDEEGYKFFERGLTGRKLAPSRVIENTWYQPDSFYEKAILYPKRVSAPGMQYQMVFLGSAQPTQSMNYTSLVPLAGPTKISYADTLHNLSRDGSATMVKKSSRFSPSGMYSSSLHDSFLSPSDVYPSRSMHTSTPYTSTRDFSPSISSFERIQPYEPTVTLSKYESPLSYNTIEDTDSASIARSGTVGKLLDKYSNFSVAKEFGYRNPQGAYNKYNKGDSMYTPEDIKGEINTADEDEDRSYLPSKFLHKTSSVSNKPLTSKNNDTIFEETSDLDYKPYQRQFSDICESEESEAPPHKIKSSLRKKNYNKYLDDDFDYENISKSVPRKTLPKKSYYDDANDKEDTGCSAPSSYVSRLRDWKNKQDDSITKKDDDEDYEPVPRKFIHNRYETALTGDEDSSLYENDSGKNNLYSSSLRKRYGISYGDDDDDESIESSQPNSKSSYRNKYDDAEPENVEPYQRKTKSTYGLKYDDPELDTYEPYQRKHDTSSPYRQKYGDPVLDNYEPYQRKNKSSYGKKYDDPDLDDIEPYERKSTSTYGQRYGDVDDEPKDYGNKRDDRFSRFLSKPSLTDEEGKNPTKKSNYKGSKSCNFNLDEDLNEDSKPSSRRRKNVDEIEEDYSKRQPYGHNMFPYENRMPAYDGGVPWGLLSKAHDPYASKSSYIDPYSTYSGYDTGVGAGQSYGRQPYGGQSYGGQSYGGQSYGEQLYGGVPRRSYGASDYGGMNRRRFTTSYDNLDDDDDDGGEYDLDTPKDQRSLASKIAKKYAMPSDDEHQE